MGKITNFEREYQLVQINNSIITRMETTITNTIHDHRMTCSLRMQ
ncbi:hypothetical protein OIU78_012645 [Salix suchowensis]|nr:hypothetical protein OIU78_012645 [Salix suchowensis]